MNIQTEQIEGHRTKFTVEIDSQRLEDAKQKAARSLAKRVNIPGFRKGKVPYRIMLQNGLEPAIVEEAIEQLSQEIYRETLEQSDVEPYGPGAFEDYNLDAAPTFIYTVPLQPVTKLGDYRAVRRDYEEPAVTEDEIAEQLKRIQLEQAEAEETEEPIAAGYRATLDIHSTFADDPAPLEVAEGEEPAEDTRPKKGDQFIHQHNAALYLDPADDPIFAGFTEKLIGAKAGEEVDFELVVPADDEEYKDIAGRTVTFSIAIEKVETVTLPELDDEFAAKVTADEPDGTLTLEELRGRISESILEAKQQSNKDRYSAEVIDEIVSISEFSFPDMMVEEQVEDMLKDFEQRLQRSGMTLDVYMRVTNQTKEQIEADYVEPATQAIKRILAMREIIVSENITVTDKLIDSRIDEMVSRFGEQADAIRGMFDTPAMRNNMANELMQSLVIDRIIAIARGEEIPEAGDEIEDAIISELPEASDEAAPDAEESAEED